MASKKPTKVTETKQKPPTIRTSHECLTQCPLPEMCLAGKRYVASIIPGRANKGIRCKGGK